MPTRGAVSNHYVGLQKIVCDSPGPTLPDNAEKKQRDSGYSSASFPEGYYSILYGVEEYIFGETRNLGRQQKHKTDCKGTTAYFIFTSRCLFTFTEGYLYFCFLNQNDKYLLLS